DAGAQRWGGDHSRPPLEGLRHEGRGLLRPPRHRDRARAGGGGAAVQRLRGSDRAVVRRRDRGPPAGVTDDGWIGMEEQVKTIAAWGRGTRGRVTRVGPLSALAAA